MKRKFAMLLAMIMLIGLLIPVNLMAAGEKDFGLENAINVAKSVFTIPASYTEFNSNINMDGTKKIWYLNWNSKDSADGSMSVSVDDHGTILSYYSYNPAYYTQGRFPKLSRQQAQVKAEEFIKKVNPSLISQLKLQDNTQYNPGMSSDYYFNYIRLVNGIPFPENSVGVNVNTSFGEVTNYNCNWNEDLTFPSADKVISLEAAQKAFMEKLGLRLVYNQAYYDPDNIKAYAAYVQKPNSNYYIDALTGDKIQLNPYWYGYGGGGGGMGMYDKKMEQTSSAQPQSLTPEEQKAVEEVSKLITEDEAEKIARAYSELNLTDDYKIINKSLSRDWPLKTGYSWNLSFNKEGADTTKEVTYINVTLDAVTGEIKGFNRSFPYNASDVVKFDEAQSKAAAEKLLQELMPAKFSQAVYEDNQSDIYLKAMGKEPVRQYNFTYVRKVNGIPFLSNTITVGFDAVYGKVTGVYSSWYDLSFPAVDKAISLDAAYSKLFSDIGLELEYRLQYPEAKSLEMPIRKPDTTPEAKLVYALKPGKPVSLDANTGIILDGNGQPYKEVKPVVYSDIAGNFAEQQINALAEYGIALEGSEFKPSEAITQQDFFKLIAKTLNFYPPADPSKEIDEMYKFLIREKVLNAEEKAPESSITREDAVKYIIRAMKYEKVAEIKGIYKCGFKDASSISPDLLGYVSIAAGLHIVQGNGGNFNPTDKVTRAQTAVMIYNYLQQ